jgi:hypothetical protein
MVNGMLASGRSPTEVEGSLGELLKLEDAIDHALTTPSDFYPEDQEMSVEDIPYRRSALSEFGRAFFIA